jgi:hypothetical protein
MNVHSAKNDFAPPDRPPRDAASPQSTQAFFLIGTLFLLLVILMYTWYH